MATATTMAVSTEKLERDPTAFVNNNPMVVNWSELPDDIIHRIGQCLPYVEDSVRFAAVCKSSYRSARICGKRIKSFGPWLMLAKLDNDDVADNQQAQIRSCYSLSSKSNKLFNLALPELQGRRCYGTNHGWLFTIGIDLDIFLFHPFTRTKLFLPSQPNFPPQECVYSNNQHICQSFITKVAISSNPSDNTTPVVAMVVYGSNFEIAFASTQDKSWTHIKIDHGIEDVIFFMRNFYCLDTRGVLWYCKINTPHPTAKPISIPPKLCTYYERSYLLEISRYLYFIIRHRDPCESESSSILESSISTPDIFELDMPGLHVKTHRFRAFVFDFRHKRWMGNVPNFNGHALLLGNNTTCAISTFDYPELKSNCIYFTDDDYDLYSTESGYYNDMGVYDLTTKTLLEPFYECTELASKFSRPFFFIPTLS